MDRKVGRIWLATRVLFGEFVFAALISEARIGEGYQPYKRLAEFRRPINSDDRNTRGLREFHEYESRFGMMNDAGRRHGHCESVIE